MFDRLKLWLTGSSGLREAARDAAREATAAGLVEGFQLGVGDFLDRLTGPQPVDITKAIGTNGNGPAEPEAARTRRRKPAAK